MVAPPYRAKHLKPSRVREPSTHGRKDLRGVLIVVAVLVLTMIVGLLVKKDKDFFIVGYIVAIAYVMRGPLRTSDRPQRSSRQACWPGWLTP